MNYSSNQTWLSWVQLALSTLWPSWHFCPIDSIGSLVHLAWLALWFVRVCGPFPTSFDWVVPSSSTCCSSIHLLSALKQLSGNNLVRQSAMFTSISIFQTLSFLSVTSSSNVMISYLYVLHLCMIHRISHNVYWALWVAMQG